MGCCVDIETGKLEWLVNGYQAWTTMSDKWNDVVRSAGETVDKLKSLTDFNIGEMKFPETKIGETVTKATDWLSQKVGSLQVPSSGSAPDRIGTAAAAEGDEYCRADCGRRGETLAEARRPRRRGRSRSPRSRRRFACARHSPREEGSEAMTHPTRPIRLPP